MVQGDRPMLSTNRKRTTSTARRPSNTAPKASAARMIHRNMQEIISVLRVALSITAHVRRPLNHAPPMAASAPMTLLSDRRV